MYKLTLSRLAGYSLAGESVATCHEYIDNCINTLTNRYGVTIKRGYHITIKT